MGLESFFNYFQRTMAGFYKTNPQAEVLRTAFNWIANNLDINYPANPLSTSSFLANEEALCQVSKLLKVFGTGIEDVKSVQVPLEKVAPFFPPLWLQNIAKQMELSNTPKNDIFIRDRNEIFVVKMERGKKDKADLKGRYGGMPENTTKIFPYSVSRKQHGLSERRFHHHSQSRIPNNFRLEQNELLLRTKVLKDKHENVSAFQIVQALRCATVGKFYLH